MRQAGSKERNRLKRAVSDAEKQVEKGEARKQQIELDMSNPSTYADKEKIVLLQREYATLKKELEDAYRRWEEAQFELEKLLAQT